MICKDNWRTKEEAKDGMEGEGSSLSRSLEDLSDAGVQLSSEVEHLLRGLSSLGSSGVEVVVEHLHNTREGGGKRVSGRSRSRHVRSFARDAKCRKGRLTSMVSRGPPADSGWN